MLSSPLTMLELDGSFLPLNTQSLLSGMGVSLESPLVKIDPVFANSILQERSTLCPKLSKFELLSSDHSVVLLKPNLQQFFADHTMPKLESLAVDWKLCNPLALGKILSSATNQFPAVKLLKELHVRELRFGSLSRDELWTFSRQIRLNRVLERVSFTNEWRDCERQHLEKFDWKLVVAVRRMLLMHWALLSVVDHFARRDRSF